MDNQQQPPVVNQEPAITNQKGPSSFLTILLSILLILACLIAGFFAWQTQNLVKELQMIRNEKPVEQGATPTPDPTADWQTFIGNEYSFKYPRTATVEESTMVTKLWFMGAKQIESDRTQTNIFDGYIFHIASLSPNEDGKSLNQIYNSNKKNFENTCNDTTKITDPLQTEIDGYNAIFYQASCLGDYTNYIVDKKGSFYEISLMHSGDNEDIDKYKNILENILSTFVFNENTNESVACTMDAKICPDGSAVGRIPPSCEFAPCPN